MLKKSTRRHQKRLFARAKFRIRLYRQNSTQQSHNATKPFQSLLLSLTRRSHKRTSFQPPIHSLSGHTMSSDHDHGEPRPAQHPMHRPGELPPPPASDEEACERDFENAVTVFSQSAISPQLPSLSNLLIETLPATGPWGPFKRLPGATFDLIPRESIRNWTLALKHI